MGLDPRHLNAPEILQLSHNLGQFECGKPALDQWLRSHAIANDRRSSRAFVMRDDLNTVIAYYTLSTGSVDRRALPRRIRDNLPNPVAIMVLGRLAVDYRWQGMTVGKALLRDALLRTLQVAKYAPIRAVVVHAIDNEAVSFYTRYSFRKFLPETRTLLLPVETIASSLL